VSSSSESISQSMERGWMLVSDWPSDLSLLKSEHEDAESDTLEGTGEDEGISTGKDPGTCGIIEKDLAGAKSTLVKTWGLKGRMLVQEKAERINLGFMDAACTFMYSGITL